MHRQAGGACGHEQLSQSEVLVLYEVLWGREPVSRCLLLWGIIPRGGGGRGHKQQTPLPLLLWRSVFLQTSIISLPHSLYWGGLWVTAEGLTGPEFPCLFATAPPFGDLWWLAVKPAPPSTLLPWECVCVCGTPLSSFESCCSAAVVLGCV